MGVAREEVLAQTVSEGLLAAMAELHELAGDHLDRAGGAIAALPRPLRSAFAMLQVLRSDLALLRRTAERPFETPPRRADWRRIASLALWTWRNG
jgi:phytoene synthase